MSCNNKIESNGYFPYNIVKSNRKGNVRIQSSSTIEILHLILVSMPTLNIGTKPATFMAGA